MNDRTGANEKPKQHTQPSAPTPVSVGRDVIIDNRNRRVGDFLCERIAAGSNLSIVSAYFTIYAYGAMREVLESAGRIRFLYGEPTATGSLDPSDNESKSFRLNEDGGMGLQHVLTQKPLARACADWIHRNVDIRTIGRANFLHGKLYHIAHHAESATLAGSSNFTLRGLGLGTAPNVELNLEIRNDEERAALLNWFDDLWADESLTRDAKADVLAALERLGRPYTPEFVYYKTLYHVFETWLEHHVDRDGLLQDVHLYDTEIWKSLYEFQRDGAKSAINRLLRHNGCIVADSVGLGKTWTALAIIKFFESRNENVLVLCPKRLEDNWVRYTSWAAYRNNPFEKDRLRFSVRAHTDLSRYEGHAAGVDLRNFNWGNFDLIVIDESHNFRNEGQDRRNEEGDIVRRSRYNRLLEEAVKGGVPTKVLMLSATPVNTSLRDLRNQIYLMTEKRETAFRETLGIGDIKSMFGVAQRNFQQWETARRSNGSADKAMLLELLGPDFLTLLDAVTIARSRDHIKRFYPDVTARIGGFPQREKPENLYPPTDSEGLLSYDDLHSRIGQFRLAIYMPSQYLKDTTSLEEEKAKLRFDQRDRERWLIGMMRVNLLKRLESAVNSFTLTMDRIIKKMDDLESRITAWRKIGSDGSFDGRPEEDMEDDEFTVGRGRRYQFEELDLERWQKDLREDRRILQALYDHAVQVTVDRDAKLAELKQVLRRKINEPPLNKDGRANRKVLVFTTFADTARYVYNNLKDWVHHDLSVHIALVTGGDRNESSTNHSGFIDILERFSPNAQQATGVDEEIDILIATDCLSEGQNLQDCDLIVNYDIHWNPVRLMQRFGRIDRLGSRNKRVAMTNFWPTRDLDRYLDLKNRVEARMALADVAATGFDDPLNDAPHAIEETTEGAQLELAFRDRQLQQMRDEILDIEDTNEGLNLNDLTLDDFIADLLHYIQQNRAALEAAPLGIQAVVDTCVRNGLSDVICPGVIFCLKRSGDPSARTPNRLWPYFLVYVRDDGTVRYTFKQAQQCLAIFRALAAGTPQASTALENAFDVETDHGRKMDHYDKLLSSALKNIADTFSSAELARLGRQRGATLTAKPSSVDQLNLVTWLVIMDKHNMADPP
ncbi:MAG: ATP-dependent helicase [Gammaproteobacteria bacterium]|nr:ATP-dependent helicase [Gammaproteobacteria bacterium]MYD76429.1 ATP-dependent helicase [Gammaproteobacteria bacterium]MYJ51392.1 ATP-dependent helicase [Gammaproteobacteria bacterium]